MEFKGIQIVRSIISFPVWIIPALMQLIIIVAKTITDTFLNIMLHWIETGHIKWN